MTLFDTLLSASHNIVQIDDITDKIIQCNKPKIDSYFNSIMVNESERIKSFINSIEESNYCKICELPKSISQKDRKVLQPLMNLISHVLIKECSLLIGELCLNLYNPVYKEFANILNQRISDKAAIHSMEMELKALHNKLHDYELMKLERNSLKRQSKEISLFKADIKRLQEEEISFENQIRKLNATVNDNKSEIHQVNVELKSCHEREKKLRAEIVDLKTEHEYILWDMEKKNHQIDQLNSDIISYHNTNRDLEMTISQNKTEIKSLENANNQKMLFTNLFPKETTQLREPEKECAVCFEQMEKVYTKPCGHAAICLKCIPDNRHRCPICNVKINAIELKI